MEGKTIIAVTIIAVTIIAVIIAGVSYMAINKWIWTPMKRGPNPIRKDDNDPASLPSSAAEASSSSPPPSEQKDDPASLPSSSAEVSSSPPPPPPGLEYDVFLSFRGADTRKGITSDLYHRLQSRGIKTFMDDRDLEVGDVISPTLLAAIKESKYAIVVLSQNYASSTRCLEELREICLCMEDDSRIQPLFYQVDPTDVRYQKGSFEEAFTKHETSGRHESEKVEKWKAALNKVANISGWNTNEHKTHQELIDSIVESVCRKVLAAAIGPMGELEEYEATRQAMDEVMKALKDDEVNAVGVYGEGGVGKTTLVKHVGAQARKNGIFHHVIMAVVLQNPNFEKLQDALAEKLGFQLREKTEIGRIDRLKMEIMRREKLLIILDDIWERIELSKIGIPSYKELQKCKSKVLLTTRRLNVCHTMESQAKIKLSSLSVKDAWTLFVTKARRSLESTKLEHVARKVVRHCCGLPIALIAVARALGDKDLAEWERAAEILESSQKDDYGLEERAFQCIRLSYDYLKDEDSKSCFLLCCLYPEDHDIRLEHLFNYAIGTGLFRRDAETIEEARGIADSVFKYLKDSSLLLDSEEDGCVKMHGVIRYTALCIAESKDGDGFLVKAGWDLKDWRPCGSYQGYSAISLMRNELRKLPEEKLGFLMASSSQTVSASPPSSAPCWKYDVFLSFRGPDTRKGITYDLYHRLQRRGIKTFMDEQGLQVGDVISPALLAAIKESRLAIVVLSQNYAYSTWCLEELREICLCMEDDSRIQPLFYQVDPTDVRYQKGSFEEAFTKHETSGRHESEKVEKWKAALNKVANISGWNTNEHKTHQELIDSIVESVCRKVLAAAIGPMGELEEYEATRQAMDEVMEALKDDEVNAVGVYGMGGVGKTTMVKHVGAQACKNGIFHHVIMAVVLQNPNFEKLQDALAEQLSFQLWEKTEIGRIARLNKEIMRREKLLIILDDVWERTELSKIGIPSYKDLQKCKSKVLLTTRIRNVCHAMECQKKVLLTVLSREDSWTLFVTKARSSIVLTKHEDVARRVAGECRGLPIALIAVARALGDKDLAEWEKAAKRLEQSQIANYDHKEDAFECIRLSYDYLKDEVSKSCFLLCCLYPEDHDIRLENLFNYAIGTGLFRRGDETIEEARGIADSVVKYLKDSSLLLDSEEDGCVKMHDVIRDTALNIAKSKVGDRFLVKAGCGLKDWWPCGSHQDYSAISLMRNEIRKLPEEELVCPNLQILLLKRNADLNEIPEKFIQSLNELMLLDLSYTSISSLPQSFSLLTNLQALYLDFCDKLIDISIVGKVKKLEILSMRRCPLKELSREIGHLTNLRILDVSCAYYLIIPSKVISKLHKLEELYMLHCGFEDWGSEIEEQGRETNIVFDEIAGLSNLKILQVCISDAKYIPKNVVVESSWDYFNICIGGYTRDLYNRKDHNSRSLVLNGATISTLPDWFINAVTKKTEKLEYDRCRWMTDILMEYDHGRLHKLKHLRVRGHSFQILNLTELMNTTRRVQKGPVFENLEELHLIDLMHLEHLCVGELPPGSLFNLKVLHMSFCHKLKNVSKFVQRLPNLEKLDLNCMRGLEYVFVCEGFEPEQSKLREMHLLGPNSVKRICSGPAPCVMFQSLKILTIYRCELLQSLFTSDVAQCFFQLEDLLVEWCPLLERLTEAVNNEKTVLPKLKNLVLKNLPMLYGASATVDIECPALEHLIVVDCPGFSVWTCSDLFESFKSLNHSSFSTSASDYFGSTNPVQLNYRQLYRFLRDRTSGFLI